MPDPISLVVVRNPFDRRIRDERSLLPGEMPTVSALVDEFLPLSADLSVAINGEVITKEEWESRTIKPGEQIVVMPLVHGGGGGSGFLGTVLMIAVAVFAPYAAAAINTGLGLGLAAGSIGMSLLTVGVSMVGAAIIGGLTAPSRPSLPSSAGLQSYNNSPAYSWSPATTQQPGGPVARAYGRHKLYGNIIAGYISNAGTTGQEQTSHLLIDLGSGPYSRLYDFKINDQPVGNYSGVTITTRMGYVSQETIPAFNDTRLTRSISAKAVSGTPVTRETVGNDYDALEIVLLCPNGLWYANDAGGMDSLSVSATVEISGDNGATWRLISDGSSTTIVLSGSSQQPVRKTLRVDSLARGTRYRVRCTNLSADQTTSRYGDDLYLAEINEVMYDDFQYPRTVLVAVDALATNQLSGSIKFSCMGDCAIVRVWNGTAWASLWSNNPAWICWDILTQPVLDNNLNVVRYDGLDPSRLVLSTFKAWADFCGTQVPNGFGGMESRCTFDGVFDTPTSLWDAALEVCAVARAQLVLRGTSVSVVFDDVRAVPAQLFSVGNTAVSGFHETFLPMQDRAASIEANYLDAAQDYARDTLTVVNTAITESAAQRTQVGMRGVTRASQAWREANFRLKRNELLRRSANISVDIDALACTVGDLIWLQNDVTRWGVGGRAGAGSTATRLILDQSITLDVGKTYEIKLRLSDDALVTRAITTPAGTVSAVDVSVAFPASPALYDVWAIGETGKAVKEFLVLDVTRDGDQRAKLSLIEYNASLYGMDIGMPAMATPNVSASPNPAISNLRTEEIMERAADGTILVHLDLYYDIADAVKGVAYSGGARIGESQTGKIRYANVTSGETYTVTVRPVTLLGREGPSASWQTITVTVIGKLAPPADVPWFSADGTNLSWGGVTDVDLAGYLLRWIPGSSRDWGQAQPLHSGTITASPWAMLNIPVGVATLLIKAVDTSGNESASPAAVVVNLGDPLIDNIITTRNLSGTGFPGQIGGGSVSAGSLLADNSISMWNPNDTALLWSANDASPMWDFVYYKALTYRTTVTVAAAEVGSQMTIAKTLSGDAYSLYYRHSVGDAAPMWGAADTLMWSDDNAPMRINAPSWMPWPGAITAEAGDYEIRVHTAFGRTRGRIDALAVNFDVPDITEYLHGISVAAGGTRLAPAKSYHAIRAVHLTLQDDGGTARTARVMDKGLAGPLINCFDSSSATTTGHVDAIIQGY